MREKKEIRVLFRELNYQRKAARDAASKKTDLLKDFFLKIEKSLTQELTELLKEYKSKRR